MTKDDLFDVDIVSRLNERFVSTPDWGEIKLHTKIPVFVYGSLKKGKGNHKFLEGANFIDTAHTISTSYVMKSMSGSYPTVEKVIPSFKGRKIRGELYSCDARHILGIDVLESNGSYYTRELVPIVLENHTPVGKGFKGREIVKAWMYITNPGMGTGAVSIPTTSYPKMTGFEITEFYDW